MAWPDGYFCVSFSGGRTSGYMLLQLLEKNGPLPDGRGWVLFQNTSREAEETLEFVRNVELWTGQEIVWLEFVQTEKRKPRFRVTDFDRARRDGSVFENILEYGSVGFLPNVRMRHCSRRMKWDVAQRFLRAQGAKEWVNYVGIRADEARRAKQTADTRVTRRYPLVDWGVVREDVVDFWKAMPFDLDLPLDDGKTLYGNCTGCFLKSERELALLSRERPDEFAWWERMEEKHGSTFSKRRSYREIREKAHQGDAVFELEGFLCQADDGDCTGE